MNKKSKVVKYVSIIVLVLIIILFSVLIYNNLFASSNSTRLDGIEDYKLTNNEINAIEDLFKEIDSVKEVDVYTNQKIIKIVVNLKEDADFDEIKNISNQALGKIKEENLEFYDIEIYVDSENEESEIYPQIGYKHKTSSEFSW